MSNAAHSIPYPPAVRIEQGRAALPAIRAGRLELLIELDDGRVYPMTAEVGPAANLTLRLPSEGGSQ